MDVILVEDADGVRTVTLNRPGSRNAVDTATSRAVCEAVDDAASCPDVRAVVLTGADGSFCSGLDLKAFARGERPAIPGRGLCGITRTAPSIPLIAAVEGAAVGGGFELALACDMIVAAESARFALPEVRRGLVPSQGGATRLARRVPAALAAEMVLTGAMIAAPRLARHGLINRLVPAGTCLEVAQGLGASIAAASPRAVEAALAVVRAVTAVPRAEWEDQDTRFIPVLTSEDAQEGAAAFAERRVPVWSKR